MTLKLREGIVASAILVLVLVANAVQAHGIWFAERSDQLALIFGVGADDLNMVERLPRVTEVAAYDVLQQPVETSLRASDYLVTADLAAHPAIVTATFDNGIWSQDDSGSWFRGTRDEVADTVLSVAVLKYTVHLRSALAEPLGHLPGQDLQIVPVDAVLPDELGSELDVRILYRGEPVAGAEIIRDFVTDPDAETIKSNADGAATIRIRNQGLNVVKAYFASESSDREGADRDQIVATLSFVLPHEPE